MKKYLAWMKKHRGAELKNLRTDNGGEYISNEMIEYREFMERYRNRDVKSVDNILFPIPSAVRVSHPLHVIITHCQTQGETLLISIVMNRIVLESLDIELLLYSLFKVRRFSEMVFRALLKWRRDANRPLLLPRM